MSHVLILNMKKYIRMSTNKPSIGTVFLKIAVNNLEKKMSKISAPTQIQSGKDLKFVLV